MSLNDTMNKPVDTYIADAVLRDGSREVFFRQPELRSWKHVGMLMPQVPDSRQQPKSLAFRMRERLNQEARA